MNRIFYRHLIETEDLIIELNKLDLTKEQKIHLTELVDSSLHHIVLDAILSELSPLDKKIFLSHMEENYGNGSGSKERIWEFLNKKIDNIEDKIKKAADDLTSELKKDLKEAGSR